MPVLASALPEMEKIVNVENIGITVKGFDPEMLLGNIKMMLNDSTLINKFKENLSQCKAKYCWENQETVLFDLYRNLK